MNLFSKKQSNKKVNDGTDWRFSYNSPSLLVDLRRQDSQKQELSLKVEPKKLFFKKNRQAKENGHKINFHFDLSAGAVFPKKEFSLFSRITPLFKEKNFNFKLPKIKLTRNIFKRRPSAAKAVKVFLKKERGAFSSFWPKRQHRFRFWQAEKARVSWSPAWSFLLVLVLIILPFKLLSYFSAFDIAAFKDNLKEKIEAASSQIMAASDSASQMDFSSASGQFAAAGENFLEAEKELASIDEAINFLAVISGNKELKLAAEAKKFLAAGALVSSLGEKISLATGGIFNGLKNDFPGNFEIFRSNLAEAALISRRLEDIISDIDESRLPEEYREKFISLKNQADVFSKNLDDFSSLSNKLPEALGFYKDRRYLIIFQNNAEMRGSGGFVGSYALLDLSKGAIKKLEIPAGGAYDTKGSLDSFVASPKPLWLLSPTWNFWDANWFPDWPSSARNLMWFYEHSNGSTVDGVIALTPTVIEKLLRISGPIDMTKEYGLVIDSSNFWDTVQTITEKDNISEEALANNIGDLKESKTAIETDLPLSQDLEQNQGNKPKKIIGDLSARLLETLPKKINKDSLLSLFVLLQESLAEKQLMFYFTNQDLQAEMSQKNWGGEVRKTDGDYLLVVNTNIGGQKSDRQMEDSYHLDSQIASDGSVEHELRIERKHIGNKGDIFTGVRNVNWLRIYVPYGSQLKSVSGFRLPDQSYFKSSDLSLEDSPMLSSENEAEILSDGTKIYEESGKTVFANWSMTDPGETSEIVIRYRSPRLLSRQEKVNVWWNKLFSWMDASSGDMYRYSLLWQKQAGAKAAALQVSTNLPTSLNLLWSYPKNTSAAYFNYSGNLDGDKYWPLLLIDRPVEK
jgi:hypothetical protein